MLLKNSFRIALSLVGGTMCMAATVAYYDDAMPTTLNPLFARTMVDTRTHELIFDRLFFNSAITNKITSSLVRAYDIQDAGLTLIVELRDDVKWHDGEQLDATDVCFTINTMLNKSIASTISANAKKDIASCSADNFTAKIEMTKVFLKPREHVGFLIIPEHVVSKTGLQQNGEFSSLPIGSGSMSAIKKRRVVEFSRFDNPHHPLGGSSVKSLTLNESLDSAVRVGTLLNGGVHGMTSVPPASRQRVEALDNAALMSYDLRSWWYIALNTNRGALSNQKIRKAVNLTIDKESLRRLSVGYDPNDLEPPCTFVSGPFINASTFYNNLVPSHTTANVQQAQILMKEAGAKSQYGRWLLNDVPITFKVGIHAPLEAEAADLLSQVGNQLQAGGFDRQVYKITNDDWARLAVTGQFDDFDMLIGKWSFGLTENVSRIFHTRTGTKGRFNIFNYSNPKADQLLLAHEEATSDTSAKNAYHDLHALLADDLPYVFLWRLNTKSAWRNEVHNNIISPYYYFTEFDAWGYSE
jgi:peptide/nickel transport system substrate-binding protein